MARNNIAVAFGYAVRRYREQLDLSQEDLADRCGLHRTYIGGVERGEKNPTIRTMFRIASALAVPLHQLIADIEASEGQH